MIADYYVRLMYLCCASFFLVHTTVGAVVLLLVPAALRRAENMAAESAAAFLFSLRFLPFVTAACAVAGLCIPSYLSLEPRSGVEPRGTLCAMAAALAMLSWLFAGGRALAALVRTMEFGRDCRITGRKAQLGSPAVPALIVDSRAPLLALSGIVRPKLFLSRGVVEALRPEELRAALRHEDAHRRSRDNLKRLACLLVPELAPFARSFAPLERNWAKFAEWAADDEASSGDSQRALWLASALLRVARMGSAPQPEIAASLTACGCGLEARVERLLRTKAAREEFGKQSRIVRHRELLLVGACTAAIVLLPGAMACVHGLLERLVR
ncbi:MAG TPA: M56 family metallopeptidase [Candidatus Acidoferrales bacterium]|nr:M56 family metallopeptidase [Candidatus Acidoferrales bacterium]